MRQLNLPPIIWKVSHLKIFPLERYGPAMGLSAGPSSCKGKILRWDTTTNSPTTNKCLILDVVHIYLPIRGGQMSRRKEGWMVSIRGYSKSRSCSGSSRVEMWELSRHCCLRGGRGPYSSRLSRCGSGGSTTRLMITAEFSMRSVRLKPWSSSLFVMWWGRRWVSNRSHCRGHGFVDWGWVIGAIKALRKQMEVISRKWPQNS